MNTFWHSIASYNEATWLWQAIIIFIGVVVTLWFVFSPNKRTTLVVKLYTTVLYLWLSVVYYFIYCSERAYNEIMALFWLILAAVWAWDIYIKHKSETTNQPHKWLAYLLLLTPCIYPLISMARGLQFPMITSPVMPCTVVLYTMGILLLQRERVNLFIVLLLCHWSVIGLSKTAFFNIPEDHLMTCATLPAVYLFFKDSFQLDLSHRGKPRMVYINALLISIFCGIAMILLWSMYRQFTSGITP